MKCQRCNKNYDGSFHEGYYCKDCITENENIEQLEKIEGHSHFCAIKQVFDNEDCICGNEEYEY